VRLAWITVVVVAACGRLDFGVLGDGSGKDGGTVPDDGTLPIDGGFSGSGCLSPGIGDNFMETLPCSQWGEPVVDNSSLNVGSDLTITPDANVQSTGGCLRSSLAFGDAGFFVHIGQFPTEGDLQLVVTDTSTSTSWGIELSNQQQFTFLETDQTEQGILPFDPTLTWWRLRPSAGGVVLYELSADGETWTSHRTSVEAPPATVGASVEDIVDAADPDPAIIDGIDICP
jgi:hypothetical protein